MRGGNGIQKEKREYEDKVMIRKPHQTILFLLVLIKIIYHQLEFTCKNSTIQLALQV